MANYSLCTTLFEIEGPYWKYFPKVLDAYIPLMASNTLEIVFFIIGGINMTFLPLFSTKKEIRLIKKSSKKSKFDPFLT